MRVGIDVSQAVYGTGVSDYTIELVCNLQCVEVVPVGFSLRRQSDLKRLFPQVAVYPIPPTALDWLWNRLHVVNFENFAPGNIDIYHSSDWAQAPDSSKKVTTIHDLSPLLFPRESDPRIVSVHQARLRWVVKECDAVICVSKNSAADFQKLFDYPTSKINVIPEALPSRFLLKPNGYNLEPYLVAIGARQPRKNIPRLISAWQKFRHKFNLPEKLVIIGEPPQPSHLKGVIPKSPEVEFTGYVSDQKLIDLIAGAAAFVYPSLYEGFGLPILIAFHHRVPVACSNTSSIPEVAGPAATYFDPENEESMASGIASAIKNRRQLITTGSKQLTKFSWTKTAQSTLTVYKNILS
ncbi:hypothetical protein A3H89_02510 [Candidatus Amesbacteria bacterium RIFCSPLOWO2_02_FULL_48_11]|uniref:Glycosyl transferase family 1 domain-containing protein n=1 Tax=Candidatus Amesbacteria bacterium RIFCSPHIGHO2_12_FULL_48_14 TaxID=1797257 RepID=A0A1F4ZCT4_9BACT|nr:MAG: hypothetical protein A2V48_01035 [Candidatus Amesbacteria bacterium RBG_19FT_COMBO_48_16]OGC99757.1 MAG: hypothetical protein A2702_02885 [Candidatus Amesbacteria bacterium RIFCSPHIGHO2_01_FULL_48_75]OGD03567.1 MAG: hypothetical protein A3E17_02665 [Candidatus Amesbacteria bacterium RIFCSPHIGHO2_12_FULL_48_14]OGD06302.1 MAG: hypothetical protein A3B58_00850 [Candidatus Amesbacteria bacterium RIFCSPLOWO2_01_FULL_48_50]OGD08387.1 MAG: hypothetical protein A3H89_02510 [Candidatus Amesbacte